MCPPLPALAPLALAPLALALLAACGPAPKEPQSAVATTLPKVAAESQKATLKVVGVAAAEYATCALVSDGRVVCWGKDMAPQSKSRRGWLAEMAREPVVVAGLPPVAQLEAGAMHFCARTEGGEVRCWGYNDQQQLGRETLRDIDFRPLPVPSVERATRLVVGHTMSCVVEKAKGVRCWGRPKAWGKPRGQKKDALLFDVPGAAAATAFTVTGGSELCGLMGDGQVRCWKRQLSHEPGLPWKLEERVHAKDVAVLAEHLVVGDVGLCHAASDGAIVCSGDLYEEVTIDDVTQLAAGEQYVCVLTKDGTVQCLGSDLHGGAGPRDYEKDHSPPIPLPPVAQLAVGARHTCAATRDGRLFCWGDNRFAELGDGGGGYASRPTLSMKSDVKKVSAADEQTCVLTSKGVSCTHMRDICSDAEWSHFDDSQGITDFAQGGGNCVLAGDEVYCWSGDEYVELDTSGSVQALARTGLALCMLDDYGSVECIKKHSVTREPVKAPELSAFASGVDWNGFCGITTDARVVCVRDGVTLSYPQLGQAKQVAIGRWNVCALQANGKVACVADHRGDSAEETAKKPANDIAWIDDAQRIAIVDGYLCAVSHAGKLQCRGTLPKPWGYPDPPKAGTDAFSLPARVVDVVAGGKHLCARLDDGSLHCWGSNERGQLGVGAGPCRETPIDVTERVLAALEGGSQ